MKNDLEAGRRPTEDFRLMAARARRLAWTFSEGDDRRRLLEYAEEIEERAARQKSER